MAGSPNMVWEDQEDLMEEVTLTSLTTYKQPGDRECAF